MAERDDHVDVVELALGHVAAEQRGAVAAHLARCAACRLEYEDVSAVVGDLLAGVPEVQPPLGFEARVLRTLAAPQPPVHHRRWQRWVAGAAAAVIVVVLAAVVWAGVRHEGGRGGVQVLERADGARVGTVSLREVDGRPVMVVAIVRAPEGVSYRCRTTLSDGTVVDTYPWPPGNGAWVVDLPDTAAHVTTVDLLVDTTETVWSSARFD
jgi:anti-sigma factor RsiW